MHPGACRVERQLADRDAHAERAEIAESENPFAIGDDNQTHAAVRPLAQDFRNPAAFVQTQEEAARPPVD